MRENELVKKIEAGLQKSLGESLVGIYLHGSLAMGCFHWDTGDIDLIAVVKEKLTQAQKLSLLSFLVEISPECPKKGIEISVVLKKHCWAFLYPTPYELHFSPHWLNAARKEPLSLCGDEEKTDYDLAAHFTMLRMRGIAVSGPSPDVLFQAVPGECFSDSIIRDIKNAQEDVKTNPVYVILNLCRSLAYFTEGLLLSKEEGGLFMMQRAPSYEPLIQAALARYRTGGLFLARPEEAQAFAKIMLERLNEIYHTKE